ncbi:AlpA family phage regulatory protein [Nitrobacter hamburgensis]
MAKVSFNQPNIYRKIAIEGFPRPVKLGVR